MAAKKKARSKKAKTKLATKRKAPRRVQSKGLSSLAATRRINARLKGLTVAAEPPVDGDPGHLLPAFRAKLDAALQSLQGGGTPFKLVEGFRTVDRQQWLYGSGRPNAQPYGRPGAILTNDDGVTKRSKHQGNGTSGTGTAGDCYPTRNGKVYIPPSSDPVWDTYATAVEAQGLIAGLRWPNLKDSPHCEMP